MIVLGTNVLSELMREQTAPEVTSWLGFVAPTELRTTALAIAEIDYGLERLPSGRRRTRLRRDFDAVVAMFPDEVLAFDAAAARHYGPIKAAREQAGRPIDTVDAQIASICRAHDAAVATRNVRDFEGIDGLVVVDPWSST